MSKPEPTIPAFPEWVPAWMLANKYPTDYTFPEGRSIHKSPRGPKISLASEDEEK
jgi:hypothetical protein